MESARMLQARLISCDGKDFLPNQSSRTLTAVIAKRVALGSVILSNGRKGYAALSDKVTCTQILCIKKTTSVRRQVHILKR